MPLPRYGGISEGALASEGFLTASLKEVVIGGKSAVDSAYSPNGKSKSKPSAAGRKPNKEES